MKAKKIRRNILCIIFLVFLLTSTVVSAGDCPYGSLHVLFRKPGETWQNATAHPRLKRGEEFEIQITLTVKKNLSVVFLKLHEFGTPVYMVSEGPTPIEKILECGHSVKTNQTFTYLWKIRVRPTTSWVNGWGPLEVFAQFNMNDTDVCTINFDALNAYIIENTREPSAQNNSNIPPNSLRTYSGNSIIYCGIIIVLFSGVIIILMRKRGKG